jgi:hypothetical protein
LVLALALIGETDLEALVEEGVGLKVLEDRLRSEFRALGLEDVGVGPERDRRAGPSAWSLADGA